MIGDGYERPSIRAHNIVFIRQRVERIFRLMNKGGDWRSHDFLVDFLNPNW
jgi:hypothetical protein